VLAYAYAQLGKPYCYAGVGPQCYDCSGLTMMAWAQAGVSRWGVATQYAHELEIRPTLGDGRVPEVADLARAVRLSRAVQVAAATVAVLVSAVCRSGRRVSPRE